MDRFAHLDWPFFEPRHAELARRAESWAAANLGYAHDEDADSVCRRLVKDMGSAGFLVHCAPPDSHFDVRSLALLREVFAFHAGLARLRLPLQGLGRRPVALAGTDAQKSRYVGRAARGEAIAAFALSEPDAGSDVAALSTRARRDGAHYVLNGVKTWISNGGIADFYIVFARTGDEAGTKGISAFVVDADAPGLSIEERIEIVAPHPMATLRFSACKVPAVNLLGAEGEGFKLAMRTLDIFRTGVAAAALGFARRALAERLYREVRALRIYEGATEVQKLIIARELLKE